MDYSASIRKYFDREKAVLDQIDVQELNGAMNLLMAARDRGATVYLCGNGGSAATASHIANDFNKGVYEGIGGSKFRFVCLSDNIPIITAIGNDIGYDAIFSFQLEGVLKAEDVLLVISGSGNSPNLLQAVRYAREVGAAVIGMTGKDGGALMPQCDAVMHIPAPEQQIVEDLHMVFDHMMMSVFCETHKDVSWG